MSLQKTCRQVVLDVVLRHALQKSADGDADDAVSRLQMVVDEPTLKILNSFLRMGDLHAEGVVSMELLSRYRQPLPDLDALYMLSASESSVDYLVGDFKPDAKKVQHREVHLAFTQNLSRELMDRLASTTQLAPRVKSMMEVPLSFVVVQGRGFHFDMPRALTELFPQPRDATLASDIARRLADVCRALQGALPRIRHAGSDLCKGIAKEVQESLLFGGQRGSKEGQASMELLIVDRSVDMAATLVHEYSYEAAIYDMLDGGMLDSDKHVVKLGGSKEDMLLSDADKLLEELRPLHIVLATEHVNQQVSHVKQGAEGTSARDMSAIDMLESLRKVPEQQELYQKLNLHLGLLNGLRLAHAQEKILDLVGGLEQDLACGIDETGKDTKPDGLKKQLRLAFESSSISDESRLRLLLLYYACITNVHEKVREQLIESSRLEPDDQAVIMAMVRTELMEVPISQRHKQGSGMVHRVTKDQAARFKRNARQVKEGRSFLSRFEPRIKDIFERMASETLSEGDYPALDNIDPAASVAAGGLRGAAGHHAAPIAPTVQDTWLFGGWPGADGAAGQKASGGGTEEVTRRLVIFVLGGMTYSELRAAQEVSRSLPGTEVLLGGTSILTPKRLIQAFRPVEANAEV
eukprot:TRINITY_DN120924_c0_g1_i1.p1 TRINITY_DN120924_c0_g1~~TRINITY_DN120924_c0_g1_i1.p1  ORF type:complete len:636 (+),score=131.94 TRINITY_DN120924_c0_g1_i1:174-2081(+)